MLNSIFKFQEQPLVTDLFNKCIESKTIPDEWNLAVVTPLYKSKGIKTDLNNVYGALELDSD
jgi:hypothetical protein